MDAAPPANSDSDQELRKLEMIRRARRLAGSPTPLSTLGHAAALAPPPLAPDSIPGYEILREIHRGSQGVVYLAIQESTRREVAVKVIRQGPFADPFDRMRFEREVRVLSALKHPNIVSIQDSGVAAGHSYFVMNYIEGEPLDTYVANASPSIDALLRLFMKICDAVSAAQICGVIHRDLKPGNIRIDQRGEPHVLDFGLARIDPNIAERAAAGAAAAQADSADGHTDVFTQTGQFVGSLPWASPEQTEGAAGSIDVRTDVYSLGVILYQVLTGRFPYPVSGPLRAVLDNIQNAAPVRPSTIRREINDEIETILLKCLQKPRARRYQTAGELSQDLQRYLHGDPIDAKRDSRLYVLRKQLWRNRLPLGAALAVFLSLIAGIIATTRATLRAHIAEEDALALANEQLRLREKADWETYKACLAAADAALAANHTAMAKARLDAAPPTLRGWEWHYLSARLDQSLATYSMPAPLCARFAISPDRRTVVLALQGGELVTLDPFSGSTESLASLQDVVTSMAIAPDGRRVALGLNDGSVSMRDANVGHEVHRFRAHAKGPVTAVAFSPDGRVLATGGAAATGADSIRLWDCESGELRAALGDPKAWVNSLAFRPDGRVLASGHTKTTAGFRLWDVETRRELFAIDYEGLDVYQVEFSPDGNRLAVASQDPAIRLYDQFGREQQTLSGHTAGVGHVAFSRDGTRLASASADQTVRVWDLASGAGVACRRGHLNIITQVVFLAGGERLLSMSLAESKLKLWDTGAGEEPPTFDTGKYFVLFVSFAPDGKRLFTHQRCFDATTREMVARLPARDGWTSHLWLQSDAFEWMANGPPQPTGQLIHRGRRVLTTTEPLYLRPVLSPNARLVALALERGVIQVARVEDGGLVAELQIDPESADGAAFNHDATRLITWADDGWWTTWETSTGRELLKRRHGTEEIVSAEFSLDGRLLATASYDGAARICDAVSGDEIHVLRSSGAPAGDQSVVWSVAFSPDGRRIATGSKDRRIRLWDVQTGQELFALTRHAGTVMCLDWSPDGTQLASGGFDGTVCLWDSLSLAERRAKAAPASDTLDIEAP